MEETKGNGDITQKEENEKSENGDVAGWIFRFLKKGWLKKKWKKNWCVLKDAKMFLYEQQTSNNNNSTNCGLIDLRNYHQCVLATKKECKKSPYTLALELPKSKEEAQTKKQKKKSASKAVNRELFYINNEAEKDQWLGKLNEAIIIARKEDLLNLKHVTKLRAKPAAVKRRPPTRQHLRDVASQSQMMPEMEMEEDEKVVAEHGGQRLTPPGPIKLLMPSPKKRSPGLKVEIPVEELEPDDTPSPRIGVFLPTGKPVPSSRNKMWNAASADNNIEVSSSISITAKEKFPLTPIKVPVMLPISPLVTLKKSPPVVAAKPKLTPLNGLKSVTPKLVISDDSNETALVDEDKDIAGSAASFPELFVDEEENTSPQIRNLSRVVKLKSSSDIGDVKEKYSSRSTKSLDSHDFDDHSKVRSAPSSFVVKPITNSDTRTTLLKAQALEAKLKLVTPSEYNSSTYRGKSKSMVILDRVDDDLPPPPELPVQESVSDDEMKTDTDRPIKKKQKKNKKPPKLLKSMSMDDTLDKET